MLINGSVSRDIDTVDMINDQWICQCRLILEP